MLIGLVGKPSVGKSTFFKAATLADVAIANYPFTTIRPNSGVGYVSIDCVDKEFRTQCTPREGFCTSGTRFVPVNLIDVAGLVPGAHEGRGLGNAFLNDLLPADVLIHIIDASGSTNEKGDAITPGTYDPARDIAFLEQELDYWYLGILKRGWDKFARTVHQEKLNIIKALAKQLSGLRVTEDHVNTAVAHLSENPTTWTERDLLTIATTLRTFTKPLIIAANKADLPEGRANITKLNAQFPQHTIIPCSADAELALREAHQKRLIDYLPGTNTFTITGNPTEHQRTALAFIQHHLLATYGSTGVQAILNTAVFAILRYICVYPAGVTNLKDSQGRTLPDCFLMPPRTTALQFAYKIHQDIGANFVKAIDVKTKRPIGKDHELRHRDMIEIMTKN